jgi:uncharacterized protein DUF4232
MRLRGGNAAAGSRYYRLVLTNRSSVSCTLFGYPGVSAVRASGAQLGSPAGRNPQHPARLVLLLPGRKAVAILQFVDTHNFPPGVCRTQRAAGVRVYPPGSFTSRVVAFHFLACSRPGRTFLSVEAVS